MSQPCKNENLMSVQDTIVWAAQTYGSIIDCEVQVADIAVPVTTPKGNCHIVKVLYLSLIHI